MPIPLIIDTDGGVDDAVAIWWACASPDVEVIGVTAVFGNVPVEVAAANVRHVLDLAGHSSVPVGIGAAGPIGATAIANRTYHIHGQDGLGDLGLVPNHSAQAFIDAETLLRDLILARPGEVTIVTLGPLTNIANQVLQEASWPKLVSRVVTMGGCATSHGNALPIAEANIASDPYAAAIVVQCDDWNSKALLVSLDVTHKATLSEAQFETLANSSTPQARFLDGPLRYYRRRASIRTPSGESPCHDLLATIASVQPNILASRILPVAVQTSQGPACGATVVDRRNLAPDNEDLRSPVAPPPDFNSWDVAYDVDVNEFRRSFDEFISGGAVASNQVNERARSEEES